MADSPSFYIKLIYFTLSLSYLLTYFLSYIDFTAYKLLLDYLMPKSFLQTIIWVAVNIHV